MKTRKSKSRFGEDSGLTTSLLEIVAQRLSWEESDTHTEGSSPVHPNPREGCSEDRKVSRALVLSHHSDPFPSTSHPLLPLSHPGLHSILHKHQPYCHSGLLHLWSLFGTLFAQSLHGSLYFTGFLFKCHLVRRCSLIALSKMDPFSPTHHSSAFYSALSFFLFFFF